MRNVICMTVCLLGLIGGLGCAIVALFVPHPALTAGALAGVPVFLLAGSLIDEHKAKS